MLQAQLVSVLHYPVVYAVVVPALRKVREGRGTRSCGGLQFECRATRHDNPQNSNVLFRLR